MEKQNPIEEALRYVDNAKQTLRENGELNVATQFYGDRKYVRAAGHYLWSGVLIALDSVFQVKTAQRQHPDIKDYKDAIRKRDHKLLDMVNKGYEIMHIGMGYDGNQRKEICEDGIRYANDIITYCAKIMPKQMKN